MFHSLFRFVHLNTKRTRKSNIIRTLTYVSPTDDTIWPNIVELSYRFCSVGQLHNVKMILYWKNKKKTWHCRKVLLTYLNRFPLLFSVRIIREKDIISSVYKLMIFLIMIVRESKFCLSFFNHFFFRIEIRFEQNRSFFSMVQVYMYMQYITKLKQK